MERLKEAGNFLMNFVDIGRYAIHEVIYHANEALDCWGPDSPEDAAVPSRIGERVA